MLGEDVGLELFAPAFVGGAVKTEFSVGTKLADDEWFLVVDLPFGLGDVGGFVLVPADIFVCTDDIERLAEWVIDNLGHVVGADEKSCSDETGGVVLASIISKRGEEFGAVGIVGCLVGHGPEDDRGLVAVAADHLVELALGKSQGMWIVEVAGPVDGDLRPYEEAETVCSAGHALVMRIVCETGVVAAEFFYPAEKSIGVFLRVGAAGAVGCFGVNADTVEEDGFAIEQDLRASNFDRAETHLVVEGVFACLELDFVELWMFG